MAMARNKFAFLTAGLVLAITFTLSCSGDDGDKDEGGGVNLSCPVSDVSENSVTCGGETYPTVAIGTQTWFAKNLNYDASGSKCYDNLESNCVKYGRLYNWPTAMTVCPSGWHLPSKAEWEVMTAFIGGFDTEGKKLKAKSGWNDHNGTSGNGTDDYGFSALPGGRGFGYSDGSFDSVGDGGFWWSASEVEGYSYAAYDRYMYYDYDFAVWEDIVKSVLRSVRCLQD